MELNAGCRDVACHAFVDSSRRCKPRLYGNPVLALFALVGALICTLGCTVGPGYKRPAAQVPDAWKGAGPWQTAAPKDAIPKGAWWQIFHDAELDRLEQELLQANQSLAAAEDRLSQARALARIASAAYFPTLSTDPNAQRQRISGNRPGLGSTTATAPVTQNRFTVPFSLTLALY